MKKRFLVYLLAIALVLSTAQSALASGSHMVLDFSEGLAAVCKGFKWGYVDTAGNVVIPYQYDDADSFSNGVARVGIEEGEEFDWHYIYFYIDKTGKKTGETAEPPTYTSGGSGEETPGLRYSEGLASVKNDDGTWSYVDESGKVVLSGLAYYWVGDFHEGRAAVVELPGEDDYFDGVDDGGGRRANPFQLNGGYIDKTGELVIPTIYNYLGGVGEEVLGDFSEGLARVFFNGNPVYIDVDGNVVISDLQYAATSFKDGLALSFRNDDVIVLKNPLTSGASTPPVTPPALVARPTSAKVLINGGMEEGELSFDAYNINDNNYFKLRDLAFVLSGHDYHKQFDVAWDAANNAILLTSGKQYTPVGGEMEGKGEGNKTPRATTSKIILDGKEVPFTAYNIEGNNYFKLRDVAEALDFGVTWNGEKQLIMISTGASYTPE
jgi:hypothetical protein